MELHLKLRPFVKIKGDVKTSVNEDTLVLCVTYADGHKKFMGIPLEFVDHFTISEGE